MSIGNSPIQSSENIISSTGSTLSTSEHAHPRPAAQAQAAPTQNLAHEISTALQNNAENFLRQIRGQAPLPRANPEIRNEQEGPTTEQIHSVEQAVDQSLAGINFQSSSRLNQNQINALLEGASRLFAVGKRDRAEQLLARFEQEIQTWDSPWALASAHRAIAGVWAQAGNHEKALQHLDNVAAYVLENPSANRGRGARFCSREDQPRLTQLASLLPILRNLYASDQSPQKIETALMRLRAKVLLHPDNVLATELRDQLEASLQTARRGVLVGVIQTVLSEWAQRQVQEHHASQEGLDAEIQTYLRGVSGYLEQHEQATLSEAMGAVLNDPRAAQTFLHLQDFLAHSAPQGFSLEASAFSFFSGLEVDHRSVAQILMNFVAANENTLRVSEGELEANLYHLSLDLTTLDRNYSQSAIQFAGLLEQRHALGNFPPNLREELAVKIQLNTVFGELQNFVPFLGHNVLETYSHFLVPFTFGRNISTAIKGLGVARVGVALGLARMGTAFGFLLPCAAEALTFTLAGSAVSGAHAYLESSDPLHHDAYQNFLRNEFTTYNTEKGALSMLVTFASCHLGGVLVKAVARILRTSLFEHVASSAARTLGDRSLGFLDYFLSGPMSFYASGWLNEQASLEEHHEEASLALGIFSKMVEDAKMKVGGRVLELLPAHHAWSQKIEMRHHLLGEAINYRSILREHGFSALTPEALEFTQMLLNRQRRVSSELDLSPRLSHAELAVEVREAMRRYEGDLREHFNTAAGAELERSVYRASGNALPEGFNLRALQLAAFNYETSHSFNASDLIRAVGTLGLGSSQRLTLLQNALELGLNSTVLVGLQHFCEGNPNNLHYYLQPFLDKDFSAITRVVKMVEDFQQQNLHRTKTESETSEDSQAQASAEATVTDEVKKENPVELNQIQNRADDLKAAFAEAASEAALEANARNAQIQNSTPVQNTAAPAKVATVTSPTSETKISATENDPANPSHALPPVAVSTEALTSAPVDSEVSPVGAGSSRPQTAQGPQTTQQLTEADSNASPQESNTIATQQAAATQTRAAQDQAVFSRNARLAAERIAAEIEAHEARVNAKNDADTESGSHSGTDSSASYGFFHDAKNTEKNPGGLDNDAAVPLELWSKVSKGSTPTQAPLFAGEVPNVGRPVEVSKNEGLKMAGAGNAATATSAEPGGEVITYLRDFSPSSIVKWEKYIQSLKKKSPEELSKVSEALVGENDNSIASETDREIYFARLTDLRTKVLNPELKIRTDHKIERVFISNRAEIALRVARTVRDNRKTPVALVPFEECKNQWVGEIISKYKGEAHVVIRADFDETPDPKDPKKINCTLKNSTHNELEYVLSHSNMRPVLLLDGRANEKVREALNEKFKKYPAKSPELQPLILEVKSIKEIISKPPENIEELKKVIDAINAHKVNFDCRADNDHNSLDAVLQDLNKLPDLNTANKELMLNLLNKIVNKSLTNITYTHIENLVRIAKSANCQADHPGYGYVSEEEPFARALLENEITLIGPSVQTMDLTGSKAKAKQAFVEADIQVVPGTTRAYAPEEFQAMCNELLNLGEIERDVSTGKLKLLRAQRIKAESGGGGMGQATVHSFDELVDQCSKIASEATKKWNNPRVIIERSISSFQHVEFQIIADSFKNVAIVGERECTLQEAGQKLLEVYPAAIFERFKGLKEKMYEAARKAALATNYTGHGTVEFMVDPEGNFYAMEINARIQVEHRVTELSSRANGKEIDLIQEGFNVARGLPLSFKQTDIAHPCQAIEARVKFIPRTKEFPSPQGKTYEVTRADFPQAEGIYIESCIQQGDIINKDGVATQFKVIATGKNRKQAAERLSRYLDQLNVEVVNQFLMLDHRRQAQLLATRMFLHNEYDNNGFKNWSTNPGDDFTRARFEESSQEKGFASRLKINIRQFQAISEEGPSNKQRDLIAFLTSPESFLENHSHSTDLFSYLHSHPEALDLLRKSLDNSKCRVELDFTEDLGFNRLSIREENGTRRVYLTKPKRVLSGEANDGPYRSEGVYSISIPKPSVDEVYNPQVFFSELRGGIYDTPREAIRVADSEKIEGMNFYLPKNNLQRTSVFGNLFLSVQHNLLHSHIHLRDINGNRFIAEDLEQSGAKCFVSILEKLDSKKNAEHQQVFWHNLRGILEEFAKREVQEKQHFIQEMVQVQTSLTTSLTALYNHPKLSLAARQLAEEIQFRREFREHPFDSYIAATDKVSLVQFHEEIRNGETKLVHRLMARVRTTTENAVQDIKAVQQLMNEQAQKRGGERGIDVLEIMMPKPKDLNHLDFYKELIQKLNEDPTWVTNSNIRRVTIAFLEENKYPQYNTTEREKKTDGTYGDKFVENANLHDLQPFTANHLLEINRLEAFTLKRLSNTPEGNPLSDADIHLYLGEGKEEAVKKDRRVFGRLVVRRAAVIRNEHNEIENPQLEALFQKSLNRMYEGLYPEKNGKRSDKPITEPNHLFIKILPELDMNYEETIHYVRRLAERSWGDLRKLRLEETVIRTRIKRSAATGDFQDVLIKVTHPFSYAFKIEVQAITDVLVLEKLGVNAEPSLLAQAGLVPWQELPLAQEALVKGEIYQEGRVSLLRNEKIKPATPMELRARRATSSNMVWAYDLPQHAKAAAENFRLKHGIQSVQFEPKTIELDLDPASRRIHPQTKRLDWNSGKLTPALEANGKPRAIGKNKSSIVLFEQTDDLGIGEPLTRLIIAGDMTYGFDMASMGEEEVARLNAGLQYALDHNMDVDFYVDSSGAAMGFENMGVEVLDAVASTLREHIRLAIESRKDISGRQLKINYVVGRAIGIMSYDISEGAIARETLGTVIMQEDTGYMGLTGHVALAAASMPVGTPKDQVVASASQGYPLGVRSLAGSQIHGGNGEATYVVKDFRAANDQLMLEHYYSYAKTGTIVRERALGAQDPQSRDVSATSGFKEAISCIGTLNNYFDRTTHRKHLMNFLESIKDKGSPEALVMWENYEGVDFPARSTGEKESGLRKDQRCKTIIAKMQIGGQPQLVIFQDGPLNASDSNKIADAIEKVNGRMPVLFMYNNLVFSPQPEAMQRRQLTHGGSIGLAVTRFKGPMVFVNLHECNGGGKVVVSKDLRLPEHRDTLRVIAYRNGSEKVIDGKAVVVIKSSDIESVIKRAGKDPKDPAVVREYAIAYAAKYNTENSIERALQLGSIDRILEVKTRQEGDVIIVEKDYSQLRNAVIEEMQSAKAAYEAQRPQRQIKAITEGVKSLADMKFKDLLAGAKTALGLTALRSAIEEGLRRLAEAEQALEQSIPPVTPDMPVYEFSLEAPQNKNPSRVLLSRVITNRPDLKEVLEKVILSNCSNEQHPHLFSLRFLRRGEGLSTLKFAVVKENHLEWLRRENQFIQIEASEIDLVINGERIRLRLRSTNPSPSNSGPQGPQGPHSGPLTTSGVAALAVGLSVFVADRFAPAATSLTSALSKTHSPFSWFLATGLAMLTAAVLSKAKLRVPEIPQQVTVPPIPKGLARTARSFLAFGLTTLFPGISEAAHHLTTQGLQHAMSGSGVFF